MDLVRARRAALHYARHGWAVTPGAHLARGRFACGRAGCRVTGCHPALERWHESASTEPAQLTTWWRRRAHTVLLVTGVAFDVLEVPAALGMRVLGAARMHAGVVGTARAAGRGPVAVTPTGRWMLLVSPGEPLRRELASCPDLVRHGEGSWIPAPPSRMPEGAVRWAVSPEAAQWRLPPSAAVQGMLVDALVALGRRIAAPAVPRQLSTARRAA